MLGEILAELPVLWVVPPWSGFIYSRGLDRYLVHARRSNSPAKMNKLCDHIVFCLFSTATWTRRNVTSSCASSARGHPVCWSPPICWRVASTCSKCPWSSTMTCQPTGKTTSTGEAACRSGAWWLTSEMRRIMLQEGMWRPCRLLCVLRYFIKVAAVVNSILVTGLAWWSTS